MNPSDATARTPDTPLLPDPPRSAHPAAAMIAFLEERLREDLARIWDRGDPTGPGRPGMVAQVAAVDEVLQVLAAGRLPTRIELRMLFFGYSAHPDFDQGWYEVLRHH